MVINVILWIPLEARKHLKNYFLSHKVIWIVFPNCFNSLSKLSSFKSVINLLLYPFIIQLCGVQEISRISMEFWVRLRSPLLCVQLELEHTRSILETLASSHIATLADLIELLAFLLIDTNFKWTGPQLVAIIFFCFPISLGHFRSCGCSSCSFKFPRNLHFQLHSAKGTDSERLCNMHSFSVLSSFIAAGCYCN